MNVTRSLVNAIVVLLMGLLLFGVGTSAVSKVRLAAYGIQCSNNMKSVGLASCMCESNNGYHARGTYPNPDLLPDQRFSWCFELLPYTEKNSIYRTTKLDKAWDDPVNPGTHEYWPYYVCPSRPDHKTSLNTCYLGMAGLGEDAATLSTNDPRSGLFGYDRKVRKEDIKDGTANTISLLESRGGGPWAQGGPGSVRGLVVSQQPYVGELQPFGTWRVENRWPMKPPLMSLHAAMADGSIRTFSSDTSPELLEALATINGGESVKE